MKQFKKMGSPARAEKGKGLDFPSNNGFSDWKLRKKKGDEEEKEKEEEDSELQDLAPAARTLVQKSLEKMKKLANHSKSRLFKTTCKASHLTK